jgi:hypothetical protein
MQLVLLGVVLAQCGRLRPEHVPDTSSYTNHPLGNPDAALRQIRTCGYPVFLKVLRPLGSDYRAVPIAQFLCHAAAVVVWMTAMFAWRCPPWQACLTASGVLWSNTQWRYVGTLAADSLALSLAVLTIGLLLLVLQKPRQWTRSVLLCLLLLACYQVRPAYLFLVPLLPLIAPFLNWLLNSGSSFNWRESLRLAAGVAVLSFVPLMAFCGLRWAVVGEFRPVSFEGYNACGVVGQFLEEDLAESLPTELQPLAREALAKRRSLVRAGELTDHITTSYMTIEGRFDTMTWLVFAPAARELAQDDLVRTNSLLSSLAQSIVIQRPGYYAIWLLKAAIRGIYMIFSQLLLNPFVLLSLGSSLIVYYWIVVLRRKRQLTSEPAATGPAADMVSAMLLIAVCFAGCKLALVMITTPPLGRFMEAAAVFFPATLAAALAQRIRWARDFARDSSRFQQDDYRSSPPSAGEAETKQRPTDADEG